MRVTETNKSILTVTTAAIVITDPQVGFLNPKGVTWHLVVKNVTENNTVESDGVVDFEGSLMGPAGFTLIIDWSKVQVLPGPPFLL